MSQLGAIRYLVVLGCILLITACGGDGGGGSDTRSGSEQTESSDSGSSGTSEEDNSSEFNDSESGDGSGTGNVDPGNEAGENTSTSDYVAPAVVSLWSDDVPFGEGRVIDDTVAFSGTGEPGHILEFWLNGVMNASTVVDSRGEWRIDFTVVTLIPDRYEVNLVTVSPAGESVASASTFTFRYDPTAPASPIISAITDDSYVAGDGFTTDGTLVITGTAEPSMTVTLYLNSVAIGTSIADGEGNWSVDYSAVNLSDGSYMLTADSTFLTLQSAISPQFPVVIDRVPPAAPSVLNISLDSGLSATDYITNDTRLVFDGVSEPFAQIRLRRDATVLGNTTADASGNWSFDYSVIALSEGGHSVQLMATDRAGNQSAWSSLFNLMIDTAAPNPIGSIALQPDTGVIGDGVTATGAIQLVGTADAGDYVEVFVDGSSVGQVLVDSSGDWILDLSAAPLVNGNYSVTTQVVDLAGNQSSVSPGFDIVINALPPSMPVISGITTDTGLASDGITADSTLEVLGTADAVADVYVYIDGVGVGVTTADMFGNWSFDHTATVLTDGVHILTAQAENISGLQSPMSVAFNLVIDTAAPVVPAITSMTTDTGVLGDLITGDNTLLFGGTSEADATIEIFIGASSVGTTTANGSGVWAFDYSGTTLSDGVYSITATAQDASGNTSAASLAYAITVDTGLPAAPAITTMTTDTGVLGDLITGDNTLLFSGTSEADATIEIFIGASSVGTTTANGSGVWTFDYSGTTLSDGAYSVTATAQDTSGNTSVASTSFNLTIDVVAPAAPSVDSITLDSGILGDLITSDNTLLISGTAEANSTVELMVGGISVGTVAADGSGAWSFDYTGTVLSDGSYLFSATATDAAANTSVASSDYSVQIDTGAPTTPAISTISTDTGVADGNTSDQTLSFSGTADAANTVELFIDTVSIGTTTSVLGSWTYNYTATTLAEGSYSVTAVATDIVGNSSAISSAFNLVVDTTAPAAPAVAAISTDTGTNNDQITSDTTLMFSGTAEANATVEVFIDAASIGIASADGSGNWSYDHTGTTLSAGSYSITATAQDLAGNTSVASSALSVTVDTVAPAAPAVTAITDDTNTASDGVTSDNQLVISGTAEANSSVEVFVDAASIGTTTADGSGNWSYDHTSTTLADGSYSVTASATDTSGNVSATSSALSITVDTGTPAAPAVTAITSDTGTAADGLTSDNSLLISGTAEANSSVEVFIDAVSIGAATTDGSGNWSYDHTGTTLADGSYSLTAIASDVAGNASAVSSVYSVTVDASVPVAPVVTAISTDSNVTNDGVTSDSTLVISGTAEANSSVEVFIDAVSVGSVTADGSGNWSFDHTGTGLAESSYTLTAQASDGAGNSSAVSADFVITVDASAPAAPVVTAITSDTGTNNDQITSDTTLVFSGTAEANATVEVFIDAASIGTASADGSGNWSYDHTGTTLSAGGYSITATAQDLAGNTSVASSALSVTVDTDAPAAPAVT
ncbi:MAG: hemagglutinin, partial [Ketobacter sp.]|nr:hemagglutinin [Ketobacter sp.]